MAVSSESVALSRMNGIGFACSLRFKAKLEKSDNKSHRRGTYRYRLRFGTHFESPACFASMRNR